MFLTGGAIHTYIRPLLQKKATRKWYRADYFENLTGGAEWGNARFATWQAMLRTSSIELNGGEERV
jgi:hypothetical protein